MQAAARSLRGRHWQLQREAGIEHVPSNDFSLYDHVLDTAAMVGAVPKRFRAGGKAVGLSTYFAMARGSQEVAALDMTKWFDTNYHYLVPEFELRDVVPAGLDGPIRRSTRRLVLGVRTRPVLLGPISFLCGQEQEPRACDRWGLLERLLPVYEEVVRRLARSGAEWIQIDEPVLALDLARGWPASNRPMGNRPVSGEAQICLATYFGGLGHNLPLALRLPVAAVHLDLVPRPGNRPGPWIWCAAATMLSPAVVDGPTSGGPTWSGPSRLEEAAGKDRSRVPLWSGLRARRSIARSTWRKRTGGTPN